jgi:YjjG family noncanonical pyrimidine nucleotidase
VTRLRYATVLFDLDHTLFDTDTSEDLAFDHTMRGVGIDDPGVYRGTYDRINGALWQSVERGERTPGEVRIERFRRLVAEAGLAELTGRAPEPLAVELADSFVAGLGTFGELYDGAAELLAALASLDGIALGLVTNGLGEVQRARLARLGLDDRFGSVVVSGEVGVSKPDPRIFELAIAELAAARGNRALMVGDNLQADIAGGRAAGLDTCWYNPRGRTVPDATRRAEHEIDVLPRLLPLVVG